MTPATSISISKIIDLATSEKASVYSLIALFFLAPLVFARPERWSMAPEVGVFCQTYRVWILMMFWLAASLLLARLISWLAKHIGQFYGTAWKRHRIRKHLLNMPRDQLQIGMAYVKERRVSMPFGEHSGAIRDLEQRGIVYQAGTVLSPRGTYPFAIHDDALEFFTEHGFQKILSERSARTVKRMRKRRGSLFRKW